MDSGQPLGSPVVSGPFKRRKAVEQNLEHITQEMYKQNLELAERNETLTLLRRIDEIVLGNTTGVAQTTQTIADLLAAESDFSLALIYVADKNLQQVSLQGLAAQVSLTAEIRQIFINQLSDVLLASKPPSAASYAISTGQAQIVSELSGINPQLDPLQNQSIKNALDIQTLFICPLRASNRLIGLLVLGVSAGKEEVSAFQRNLVDRLTGTISIAVENYMLYEGLQEASARLRIQNDKLKELDQTKDEFISMASHQLRTPLTAIKGYLSIILDGDTGEVKNNQKDMIQHAFDAAQRMVYLIADLLNVSRLQTGKFVIDNHPADLTEVVQGEVEQLKEQAANRQIELIYKKPATFPVLNLDETKIRQVIMNFLDNALYYTPKGGKVEAALQATPEAVYFTVTDTGMGVPASVQHQLFSKFYRADNAKKMRPDGTGLGLFMAKKVIVAQGGAIVFKSTEGKGSVFGFTFPRKGMETTAAPADKSVTQQKVASGNS